MSSMISVVESAVGTVTPGRVAQRPSSKGALGGMLSALCRPKNSSSNVYICPVFDCHCELLLLHKTR